MTISATSIALVVSVASDRVVVTFVSDTVGGSLTSVMVIDSGVESSGVAPTSASSTSTVTSNCGTVS